MKKTRLYINIGVVGCMLAFASCEKQVFEEPYANLSPQDAFDTPERIAKAATGMYDQLQNAEYLGGRVLIYADIRGIDAGVPSYFSTVPQFNLVLSTNSVVADAWEGAYRTIYEANNFLKNLAANPGKVSQEEENQYTAEAKFIRSLSYFYLVNLWAQPYKFSAGATHDGVPLALTVPDDPFSAETRIPRSSVAQVYSQMEADLLDAESKLEYPAGDSREFADVARATRGAVQALLARIYLYKGDYAKTLEYTNKLISSGKYALNTDGPTTAFRTFTTKESIFSVAHNGADNPNTNNALGQHYAPDKRGDVPIATEYVNLMTATDKRRTELVRTYDAAPGTYWTAKYTGITDWVPVLRYSEVLLSKAEALANQSATVDVEAVALVNQVRARSNATPIVPATKQALIDAILLERRIELAFEGQGTFEFLRTGRGIPAHSTVAAQAYGSNYVILPIPKYDTDQNPNLRQNPGY
jgi:hypothetical protein